jgi:hypothetical protein
MSDQQNRHSVCLALIHNNNAQRYGYIHPALEQLRVGLSQSFTTTVIEVSFQPEIRPHSKLMTLYREVMYRRLGREWSRYRILKVRLLPLEVLDSFREYFFKYVSPWGRSALAEKKRISFRETAVTNKHIHAWNAFLESGAEFFICFEDDAVFKEDSSNRVNELLVNLSQRSPSSRIYVDLAGGCEYSALKIDNLETGRDGSFRYYCKPVTNTACCYLLSRPLAKYFIEMVIRRPWLRLIGVDWLMNKLFILAAEDGVECTCMHASPTIFKHGSVTGEYTPWQIR